MKNQISQIGKKLNKKELKSITGGMYDCMVPEPCEPYPGTCESHADANGCTMIHPRCGQKICRP
ncbi:hypothetical protein C1631_004390 [Chryseobacterium phosphatilyticum]|uniref:Bacteriocin n=1 Tax=Chryseobacterium phosphatilyticum TaxID=475075 RepID=A0A316XDC7_9FLAO|nr:bacteriocin [Chryseobacterium phosphatilyticum]PWN71861.1 hypothetical protein C1631_004390 [Chryseobacterium phosphatilyticum]